jgi:pyruvate dehydrogenase E1 component
MTLMNENYQHPEMPEGCEEGIRKGMYLLRKSKKRKGQKVQLMGSGTILREVLAAADMLEEDFGVRADVWSVTSFTELSRDAMACERHNMLNPLEEPKVPYVTQLINERGDDPVIASTDYVRAFADQVRAYVPGKYKVLGTDGYGRSDFRKKLRDFFEVDRRYIAVAALKALADENKSDSKTVAEAIKKYDIDPNKANPMRS